MMSAIFCSRSPPPRPRSMNPLSVVMLAHEPLQLLDAEADVVPVIGPLLAPYLQLTLVLRAIEVLSSDEDLIDERTQRAIGHGAPPRARSVRLRFCAARGGARGSRWRGAWGSASSRSHPTRPGRSLPTCHSPP